MSRGEKGEMNPGKEEAREERNERGNFNEVEKYRDFNECLGLWSELAN